MSEQRDKDNIKQTIRPSFIEINKSVYQQLNEEFKYKNSMQTPCFNKVVISICLNTKKFSHKSIEDASLALHLITGQTPVFTKAIKSVSNFKIRAGAVNGCKVSLRGNVMMEFLERLCRIYLPRIRDFKGIPSTSINNLGMISLGITDLSPFIELPAKLSVLDIGLTIAVDIRKLDKTSHVSRIETAKFMKIFNFPIKWIK